MKRLILFICAIFFLISYTNADIVYVKPFVAGKDVKFTNKKAFSVYLEADADYVACQFDLYLPSGISITTNSNYHSFGDIIPEIFDEDIEEYEKKGEIKVFPKKDTQGIDYYTITYANEDLLPFSARTGTIIDFCYKSDASIAGAVYDIKVKNTVLVIDGKTKVKPADATSHVYVTPFNLTFREGYGTFVAPFDVTLPEAVKAFADGEVCEDYYKLGAPSNMIPANTPVFVKAEKQTTVTFKDAPEIQFEKAAAESNTMIGAVVSPVAAPSNSYVLQMHQGDTEVKLYRVSEGVPISLFIDRCCLNLPGASMAPAVLRFQDEENAIKQVEAENNSSLQTYDLIGRPATSGLMIRNNKIIFVK